MAVFVPSSIRDKAVRDTLLAIVRELGIATDGTVTIQANDPNADDPGTPGQILYSEDSGSIWIFDNTEWLRVSNQGADGTSTGFRIDMSYSSELGVTTDDPSTEIQTFAFSGELEGAIEGVEAEDAIFEIQEVALVGTLDAEVIGVIGVDAVAEVQDVALTGTLAGDIPAVIEVDAVAEVQASVVSGSLVGVIPAVAEVESVGWSGTRSNVFIPSANEIVTVSLVDTFESGATTTDIQLDLETASNSVTHEIGNIYSWPTGDLGDASLPTGWDYIAGLGSGTSQAVSGQLVNNTGAGVNLLNATMSVTINVTSLPADGTTRPTMFISQDNSSILIDGFGVISALGSYTATDTTSTADTTLADGEALSLFVFETTTDDQGFAYTVTDVQLNTGSTIPSAYSLDIDTADSVFVGDVAATFGEDNTATQALNKLGTDVTTMFSTITTGTVYSQGLPVTGATTTSATRDTDGNLAGNTWDLRDSAGNSSLSVTYTAWNDWVGNFFGWGVATSTFFNLTQTLFLEGTFENLTLTLTDNSDTSITATFNLDTIVISGDFYYSIISIVSQAGTPPTSNTQWDVSLTGDIGHKSIDLDTNQTTDILAQMFVLTANSGFDVMGQVDASDGNEISGQASTYTVLDYSGTEVTSFTSFVSANTETDLATILNTIETAIDTNVETPIDFMAVQNATLNRFDLTAVSGGAITGAWSITANHHNQVTDAGDIAFGTAVVQTAGADEIDAEQAIVTFTSPQGDDSSEVTVEGPKTAAEIATVLSNFITVTGWTVSLSSADTLSFTAEVAEAVTGLFSSVDTNSHVTTVTTVTTEGVDYVAPEPFVPAETASIMLTSPQGFDSNLVDLTGPLTAAEILTSLVTNLVIPGWVATGVSSALRLTAEVEESVEGLFTYLDTDSSIGGVVSVITEGVDFVQGVTPVDAQEMSITFTSPQAEVSNTITLTGPQTSAEILTAVAGNLTITGWTVSSLNARVRLTAEVAEAVTGLFSTTDTENNITSTTTVAIEGADAIEFVEARDAQVTTISFVSPEGNESADLELTGPLTSDEIVTAIVEDIVVDGWAIADNEGVEFTADTAGEIDGEFVAGETGGYLTITLTVVDGADDTVTGGSYTFATGRIIDNDYAPPVLTPMDKFAASRSTYWTGILEPNVVNNPALYTYVQIVGGDGTDGFNTAIPTVYKRSATEPTDAPTEEGTYTFSTATLLFGTEVSSNGWFNSPNGPSGTDQLYLRQASAVSRSDTDTIEIEDWSGVVQAGTMGLDGQDGLNSATVYLYQRTMDAITAPADPTLSSVYTFSTGLLDVTDNNGWMQDVPEHTDESAIWFIFATAASRESTDVIAASEWSDPSVLSINGIDGFSPTVVAIEGGVRITDADGNTVDVFDGNEGEDGDGLEIIYIAAIVAPLMPDPSLGAPMGWSFTVPTVPEGSRLYASVGVRPNNVGNYVWGNPVVFEGMDGTDGDPGTPAIVVYGTSNDYSILYDEDGLSPTPTTVTLTGTAQNVTNGLFKFTGGGSDFPDETTFTEGDTATTATRTFTAPTSISASTVRGFTVAVADNNQTELAFDTFTINLFKASADGTNGTDGVSADTALINYGTNGNLFSQNADQSYTIATRTATATFVIGGTTFVEVVTATLGTDGNVELQTTTNVPEITQQIFLNNTQTPAVEFDGGTASIAAFFYVQQVAPEVVEAMDIVTITSGVQEVTIAPPPIGMVSYSNLRNFVRAANGGVWSPTPVDDVISTDATVIFRRGATSIGRIARRIAYDTINDDFTITTIVHPLGDLNLDAITVVETIEVSEVVISFAYSLDDEEATINAEVDVIQGGLQGDTGLTFIERYASVINDNLAIPPTTDDGLGGIWYSDPDLTANPYTHTTRRGGIYTTIGQSTDILFELAGDGGGTFADSRPEIYTLDVLAGATTSTVGNGTAHTVAFSISGTTGPFLPAIGGPTAVLTLLDDGYLYFDVDFNDFNEFRRSNNITSNLEELPFRFNAGLRSNFCDPPLALDNVNDLYIRRGASATTSVEVSKYDLSELFTTVFTSIVKSVNWLSGDNLFIVALEDGRIFTSPTGETWTDRVLPISNSWTNSFVANNRIFVWSSELNNTPTAISIIYSDDGITWLEVPHTFTENNEIAGVAYDGSDWLIVNKAGEIIHFAPGDATWTLIPPTTINVGDIADDTDNESYYNAFYYSTQRTAYTIIGTFGIQASTDLINWYPEDNVALGGGLTSITHVSDAPGVTGPIFEGNNSGGTTYRITSVSSPNIGLAEISTGNPPVISISLPTGPAINDRVFGTIILAGGLVTSSTINANFVQEFNNSTALTNHYTAVLDADAEVLLTSVNNFTPTAASTISSVQNDGQIIVSTPSIISGVDADVASSISFNEVGAGSIAMVQFAAVYVGGEIITQIATALNDTDFPYTFTGSDLVRDVTSETDTNRGDLSIVLTNGTSGNIEDDSNLTITKVQDGIAPDTEGAAGAVRSIITLTKSGGERNGTRTVTVDYESALDSSISDIEAAAEALYLRFLTVNSSSFNLVSIEQEQVTITMTVSAGELPEGTGIITATTVRTGLDPVLEIEGDAWSNPVNSGVAI